MSNLIHAKIVETLDDGTKSTTYLYIRDKTWECTDTLRPEFKTMLGMLKRDSFATYVAGYDGKFSYTFKRTKFDFWAFLQFCSVYQDKLYAAQAADPEAYVGDMFFTYQNMRYAIASETYNKDSESFRATCKHLGIKHTYKAIREYCSRTRDSVV